MCKCNKFDRLFLASIMLAVVVYQFAAGYFHLPDPPAWAMRIIDMLLGAILTLINAKPSAEEKPTDKEK